MTKPDPVAPLHNRAVSATREAILSGAVRPGEVLAETRLAEQLGMSRGPIREALAELGREGIVTLRHNQRARVTALGIRDVEEIYSLRRSLELLAVQRAASNITEAELRNMRGTLGQMDAALDRGDLVRLSRLDVAFHDYVYVASRHERLYRMWAEIRSQVTLFLVSRNSNAVTSRDIAIGEHETILDALAARDAELLARLTDEHLRGAYERLRDALIMSAR